MAKNLRILQFGEFELDEALLEVREKGTPVEIAPRSLQLLRYLIEHRDRLVSKDELFEKIWEGVVVSDAALAGALRALRRALGDEIDEPRWLLTRRARGYRFIGEVNARPALPAAGSAATLDAAGPEPSPAQVSALVSGPSAASASGPSAAPASHVSATAVPHEWRGNLPPLPRLVLGRDADIAELRARLVPAGPRLCAVHGWPGVGKTTLAALLARDSELVRRYPDGVLWSSLGPASNPHFELKQWARALGRAALLEECGTVQELAQRLGRALAEARLLLVLDDLWKIADFGLLRIGGEQCGMLVTTRLPRVADAIAVGGESYRLGLLSAPAALQLLGLLVPAAVAQYPHACEQLIGALEGLPLAVHVAAGLIKAEIRRGFSVDDVLKELLVDARRVYDSEVPSDLTSDASPTVAALIERSTQSLDHVTRERFAALGVFADKPAIFDEEAIQSAWAAADPRASLAELVDRGLLESAGAGRYQMHALLKTHAEALLERAL